MLHFDTEDRELCYDTVDGIVTLGHSRQDTVDGTVTFGHSRQLSYTMTQ